MPRPVVRNSIRSRCWRARSTGCSTVVQAPSSAQRGSGRRKWLAKIVCVISCGRTESRIRSSLPWIVIVQPNTSPRVEDEARGAAGAEVRGDLGLDRAGPAPARQRTARPLDRQVVAILLGGVADPAGERLGRCLDDEVRGPVPGSLRLGRRHAEQPRQDPTPRRREPRAAAVRASNRHACRASMHRVGPGPGILSRTTAAPVVTRPACRDGSAVCRRGGGR